MTIRTRAADLLPLVPAAAIPLVFLHVKYQAHVSFGGATVDSSDVMVILALAAAAASGLLFGWQGLLRVRLLWITAAALLALFVVSCFWRPLELPKTHLITAAKYLEYALLAPAAVLLFRLRVDVMRFFAVYIAWGAAASVWGLLQFLGLVSEFEGKRPGQREVSFLGHEDFGAFTAGTLMIGLAALVLGERPRLAQAAILVGALGVILDGSISVYLGVLLAALAALWIGRRARTLTVRRFLALAGVLLVVGAGVNLLRGSDVSNYLSFLGVHRAARAPTTDVQTGSQRVLLLYIGLRIWEDHPWLGVGFERSGNRYQPYLAAAHRRYPNDPPLAFPSAQHPWGIQDFWVQLLADTGVLGFLLGIATFATGALTALRAPPGAYFVGLVAAGWILIAAGTLTAQGIVAGLPVDAVTWLGLGLAVAAHRLADGEPGTRLLGRQAPA